MSNIDRLYARLTDAGVDLDRLLRDEPMSRHTTFRVGGPADLMLCANSGAEIACALKLAGEEGVPASARNACVRDCPALRRWAAYPARWAARRR